jgi:hypothetical protein
MHHIQTHKYICSDVFIIRNTHKYVSLCWVCAGMLGEKGVWDWLFIFLPDALLK